MIAKFYFNSTTKYFRSVQYDSANAGPVRAESKTIIEDYYFTSPVLFSNCYPKQIKILRYINNVHHG